VKPLPNWIQSGLWGSSFALALLLGSCKAIVTPPPTPTPPIAASATPRPTATFLPGAYLTPIPATPTFTPVPTPTPIVHQIESGDTLFGIAIEYGVSLDALLVANGIEANDLLSIGQIIIIPTAEPESGSTTGMAAPVGNQILPTPTPVMVPTTGVALYQTPAGGLWCLGEVVNTTGGPLTNLQLQVVLVAADGTPLLARTTLAAADYLAPEARTPFAVLFEQPPAGVADVTVVLLRAEAISAITAAFVPLDVTDVIGGVSGPQYRVTGALSNHTGYTVSRIAVVITLYDSNARVIGYREKVTTEEILLENGQSRAFDVLLTPQGLDVPADFQVIAWAVTQ